MGRRKKEKPFDPNSIVLRDYQQECVDIINGLEGGSHLISLATGLGKTVIFSHIKRTGRMLILSHREELVKQPQKYFTCTYGIEKASERSNGEDVVSASVQSLVRRLDRFDPHEFDILITDEAHHAAAPSYRKIYEHFKPRIHLGFTATPNRGDKVRLDDIFDDIIFHRDMRWGIQNGYLSDIRCLKTDIGYDLSRVRQRMGDFNVDQLDRAINTRSANDGVAKAYKRLAVGQTMIFAASVAHAQAIASRIPKSAVVTADTENREAILQQFREGKLRCLVNCMVFSEGTDLPMISTIIMARPTQNESLYTQCVGRGTRLYPGKKFLTLIDCIGFTGEHGMCTAPSLFGLDASKVPPRKRKRLDDVMLTNMENEIAAGMDIPDAWIINTNEVDLFASENGYQMHNICWQMRYDGSFACSLGKGRHLIITAPNELGRCSVYRERSITFERINMAENMPLQVAFDKSVGFLHKHFYKWRFFWDKKYTDRWGVQPASGKQKDWVAKLLKDPKNLEKYGSPHFNIDELTKYQASILIDRLSDAGPTDQDMSQM